MGDTSGRVSSFTLRQAAQRNAILSDLRSVHDSPTGQRTALNTCTERCLACLVARTLEEAEFVTAPARVQP